MIIADTSVWIPFFNRPDSKEKHTLDILIDADEVSLAGVVLAELLQGCRTSKDRHTIQEAMLALPYFEMNRAAWIRAGEISAALLRRGITLPMSDLIVAALALEHQCRIYSLDSYFAKIPGLSRFNP
ncbi:MAG: hypothetical protein A2V83_11210 [Nitrospirae bacterium RBG_16_64_22]|nr:MAG: hypothetical protein A2V83_11210 [Nitrospirae bacterium RBG_16_64_22]